MSTFILSKKSFLESEQEENKQLNNKISEKDRQLEKLRLTYGNSMKEIESKQDELQSFKNTLTKTAQTLDDVKSEINRFNEEKEMKTKRIGRAEKLYEERKNDLEKN